MDLICEHDGKWVGVLPRYSLDLAFGDDEENDFTLEIPETYCRFVDGSMIETGDYVFVPNTEWGGVIDGLEYDNTDDEPVLTYSGRTWHGILSHSIVRPDSGQDYYKVSGNIRTIISNLISRQGLGGAFVASGGLTTSVGTYQFERYTNAYDGLCKLLRQNGMRLNVSKSNGKCVLSAVAVKDISRGVDENYLRFKMEQNYRPTNHLVCLGSGELKDRIIVDLYMDDSGKVSKTQTFFGVDEVADTYDSNNAEADELTEKGTENLQDEYADSMSIDADIPDDLDAHIGDSVTGSSVTVPLNVKADISTITVKLESNETPEVSYKVGSVKVI